MTRLILCLAASVLFSAPALAKVTFSTYEAADPVITGKGGAKTTDKGIDWWTEGSPPKRYRIIGILTDDRGDGRLSGNAVGSKSIAKKVREVGGDAVVLLQKSERQTGSSTYVQQGQGYAAGTANAITTADVTRTTTFVVIKVLDPS
jgi:hypothetical protein